MQVTSAGSQEVGAISVHQCDTMVRICYSSNVLSIEGTKEKMAILADNIEYVASSASDNTHIHIEYYEDHPYVDAGWIPLTVSRRDD